MADGIHVLRAHQDGAVMYWDMTTGARVRAATLPDGAARALAVSAAGLVALGGDGTSVYLWDPAREAAPRPIGRRQKEVTAAAFATSTRLVSTGVDGVVHVWSVPDGSAGRVVVGGPAINAIDVSRNARYPSQDSSMAARASGPAATPRRQSRSRRTPTVTNMAYARSGGRILLATRGAVHVLQRVEGRWPGRVHRFQGRTIGAAEFNRDGTQIAIAAERVAHVLDATTGGTRATLEGHSAPVLAVAFSGDGMRLATEAPIEPP